MPFPIRLTAAGLTLLLGGCSLPSNETGEALTRTGELVAMSGGDGGAKNACVTCHGLDGMGDGISGPRLAGLEAGYLQKQMEDYAADLRHDDAMTRIAARLDQRQRRAVAIFYADKPGWESTAAHVTHYVFYTCLIGLPLTGWAMVSATARDQQLTFLGWFDWPLMPMQSLSNPMLWWIENAAEWMHWGLIVSLLLLIPIHAGAALKHQIIDRDDVLHAMAPVVPLPTRRRTAWQRRYRALEKQVGALASGLLRRLPPLSGSRRPGP